MHALDAKLDGDISIRRHETDKQSPASIVSDESAKREKEKIIYTGFIAQDVEAAANKVEYDFSGIHKPSSKNDVYGLSYSDFVVPLVKAVQELDVSDKKLQEENLKLKEKLALLEQMILNLKSQMSSNASISSLSYLEQNTPNPVNAETHIRYYVPETVKSASLRITNMTGQLIKSIKINNYGNGEVKLNSSALAAGNYNYTLLVDGKQIDTKRLLITRP